MKLLEEQRERLQIDDIRTILCIALGEHSRLADDVTADLMHEIFQRAQRFTGADDVVYDENTLTLQHCAVFFGEVQRLDMVGRDGFHLDLDRVRHVRLDALYVQQRTDGSRCAPSRKPTECP